MHFPPGKPQGLWLSVGNAWADWCGAHGASPAKYTTGDHGPAVTQIVLRRDARVLRLAAPAALRRFTRTYSPDSFTIDWTRVAKRHDGIIINPFQGTMHLELLWYYGWDVASGCIWHSRAVARLIKR